VSERLEERLQRLEEERQDADRRYNDALTALDRALSPRPALPPPPAPYDASRLPEANEAWQLPSGPSGPDGSIKGKLRAFVWRVMGPVVDAQRRFNSILVDHLNRNVAAHRESKDATDALIAGLAEHLESQAHLQARLLALLQTVTLYVDTKDRAVAGGHDVLNAGLSAVNDGWMKRWESLAAREERFGRRVASVEDIGRTASLAQQTALSLKREVERLVSHGPTDATPGPAPDLPAASDLDSFKYVGFEDQFRGSTEDIRARLSAYAALFDGQADVLDVGCGRGEFLELLKARGVGARGVELNHAMVEASRARGLEVAKGDALSHVASLADASLGGIFAAQVVEHLAPEYLARLLETAAHKLRPGGLLVLETINPACWLAFFESYLRDLTHVRPLHPETLQYLVRVSGLHDVRIEYTSPVAEAAKLDLVRLPEPDLPPALHDIVLAFNENAAKLNARLFTFQDYAVIARK
jgi:SAM-dependent methyltransferase